MRSFIGLLIFVLCFLEVVFAVPAPVGSSHSIQKKGAASLSAKKIVPNKAPAIKHAVPPKKKAPARSSIPKTLKPAPKKTAPLKTKTSPMKTPPKVTPKKKTAPVTKKTEPKTTCALKKKGPAAVSKKVKREEVDFGITRRSFPEFIGFHGTSGPTAAKYMKEGKQEKPLPILPRGFFNGNNAELAPGIYVTDTVTTALNFATTSANNRKNKGETSTTAMVCMVEAFRTPDWIGRTPKIWVRYDMLAKLKDGQNNPVKLFEQEQMAKCEGFDPKETVRFSSLENDSASSGKPRAVGNQVAIPTTQFHKIFIDTCMEVNRATTENQVLEFFQKQGWPQFSYSDMKEKWNIKP